MPHVTLTVNSNYFNCNLMSNVWTTMPYVQLSHKWFVTCTDNRQSQLFSEISLCDVMELPTCITFNASMIVVRQHAGYMVLAFHWQHMGTFQNFVIFYSLLSTVYYTTYIT